MKGKVCFVMAAYGRCSVEAVFGLTQEQYQYLYRGVLSLVSSQEDQRALQSAETNGSVPLGQNNIAESLESLM